jgi:peptide chain release factor 3
MRNEYGVDTTLEPLGYSVARWVTNGWDALDKVGRLFNTLAIKDHWNRPVLLFKNEWNVNQLLEDHPSLKLSSIAPITIGSASVS